jgi:hypothetical protein
MTMAKTTTSLGLELPDFGQSPREARNLKKIDDAIAALHGTGQGTFLVRSPAGDQTVAHKIIAAAGFQGPVVGAVTGDVTGDLTGDVTGNVTGNVTGDLTGNVKGGEQEPVANYAASGAISQKEGLVTISKSSDVATMTLADPSTPADDGKLLRVVSKTAKAHVITITGGLAGGSDNTVTLGGAIGDLVQLQAIGGKWYMLPSINATASHV